MLKAKNGTNDADFNTDRKFADLLMTELTEREVPVTDITPEQFKALLEVFKALQNGRLNNDI